MCNYWLHILKHEPHAEGCTLAASVSPTELRAPEGKIQTANYKSWSDLAASLSEVGVNSEMLKATKAALDSEGLETLREIPLSVEQLRKLGFHG